MNAICRMLLGATVVAALMAIEPETVWGQASGVQDAGSKIRGDVYWPGRAATRYVETARNYAQEFQSYVAKAPRPEPSVVREFRTELGRYIDDAQKHLATMKKDFQGDAETVAAIEGIEKELAAAIAHHKEMIACCEKETFDKIGAMQCCTDLVKSLDKVRKDHVALMQKLSQKHGAPASTTGK